MNNKLAKEGPSLPQIQIHLPRLEDISPSPSRLPPAQMIVATKQAKADVIPNSPRKESVIKCVGSSIHTFTYC